MRSLLILSLFVVAGCAAVPAASHHNSYEHQQQQAGEAQQRLDRE